MRLTTFALLVTLSTLLCKAQHADKRLQSITTINTAAGGINRFQLTDTAHVLITVRDASEFNTLKRKGVHTFQRYGTYHLIVKARELRQSGLSFLLWSSRQINCRWKLSENLLSAEHFPAGSYIVETADKTQLVTLAQRYGIAATLRDKYVLLSGDIAPIIDGLVQDPDVTYVGKESFTPKEESEVLDLYHGPNKVNTVHHKFPELDGQGIVISLKERHYNIYDIDLIGRHLPSPLASNDSSTHATDMATITAGAGNSFITGRGVAQGAMLTSSSFTNLFPDADNDYKLLDVSIQNHAYGTVIENFYGALAAAYDESANRNPEVLHVFSAGNSGPSNATSGQYLATPGFANITGNSKLAKNVLVVGAIDTTGNVTEFSSRGPAHDGRLKPEMVAYSTAGTSNAASLVSGVAALCQQVFQEAHQLPAPSSLVKALLITAADDIGPSGIDFYSGYGNLNALRTIENLKAGRYFQGEVSQNQIKTFNLSIPASARNLKVTLVWNDPAATVNNSKALINDIDLEINSAAGTVRPWIVDASPSSSALTKPAIRGIDRVNNIEQVTIAQPAQGEYSLMVKGSELTSTQPFFVAYQWDEAGTFEWTYPTGSDNFPYNGETGTYFYWRSSLAEQTGDLEVSIDNGETWTVIRRDIDLASGYYRWSSPFESNTSALARMNVAGAYFLTEDFTISRPTVPGIGFNCSDSLLLQWPKMNNVERYSIASLQDIYMKPFTTEADTNLVIDKNGTTVFAIQALLADGTRLLRSRAVNASTFGTDCFTGSLVDEAVSDNGVLLRFDLATLYAVRSVTFQLLESGVFKTLETLEPNSLTTRYLHTDPPQGTNRYRVVVDLQNGQQVVSETLDVYFLTKTPFAIFPNPVTVSQDLNIFSGKFETVDFTLKLYKADGTLVRTTQIISDRDFLSTDGLTPGLYVYRIEGREGNFSGKILIKGI